MPIAAWPERLLSKKSGRCVLQQIKERGALPMIVVISVRQSTATKQYLGFTAEALVMVSSSIRLTAWLQNSSGRNGQRDWCMSKSPRLSPLWLSASSSACHGLLIITVITPLPTSPARQVENWRTGERGNYWHADASAWCCCARCKIHEGVSWC